MEKIGMMVAAGIAAAMMALPASVEGAVGLWNLPVEVVAPRDGAAVRDADGLPLWDLSTVLADRVEGMEYRVYGDSLVSEEYDRVRCWYATVADSCGLLRMEGLLWRLDPLTPVVSGSWSATALPAHEAFAAALARESLANDTLGCRLERDADIAGRLVLPGADTLRAVMRRDCIGVTDAGGEYVQETRRWFAAADRRACALPLAAAMKRSYGGRMLREAAFVPDARDLAGMEDRDDRSDTPDLGLLDVRLDGRTLTVTAPAGALPDDVRTDITDLSGRSYITGILSAGGILTLDLSALPPGTYIAVFTCRVAGRKEPLRL